ncbi:MAG: hypothetical protein IJS65_04380 [Clostridia bacterium]|nr:hypothetical protein [Clostridia bacterium]
METNAQNALPQGELKVIPQNSENLDNNPRIKDNENADKNIKETNNSSSMPNCNKAITPKEKFYDYSLDPANSNATGKAEAYKNALGYTKENAEELIEKISDAVISEKVKPYDISKTEYGIKYKYRISITGPNGNTRNVIAVYQIDADSDTPRMITNYVEGRK